MEKKGEADLELKDPEEFGVARSLIHSGVGTSSAAVEAYLACGTAKG